MCPNSIGCAGLSLQQTQARSPCLKDSCLDRSRSYSNKMLIVSDNCFCSPLKRFTGPSGRVYPLCFPSSGTNAGTSRVVGPERIPIDPSPLTNTRGLATKREHTWFGQAIEGVPSQGFGTVVGDWAVHGCSRRCPTTIDPIEDK